MRKLLFLTLLTFAPRLATAQEVKTPVVPEKVTYSRAIPKGLRAFVPRGGKSRFWGATNLKYNGQQVWVHVYDVEKTDFTAKFDAKDYAPVDFMKYPSDGVQRSALQLWVQYKKQNWKPISCVPFEYLRFGVTGLENDGRRPNEASFESIGVQTFWLNARSKANPIFQVDFINPAGFMGAQHLYVWIVFSNGLEKKPIIQSFQEAASGLDSWGIDAIGTDQTGNVLVKLYHGSYNQTPQRYTLKWKGKGFVADQRAVAP